MRIKNLQIECLVQALSFEILWAYYTQSGGRLYAKECRKMAIQFVESYTSLSKLDPRVLDPNELNIGEKTNVVDIVQHLKDWADGKDDYPYPSWLLSKGMLFAFLGCLKGLLLRKLKIHKQPVMVFSTEEEWHSARVVRWQPHMGRAALMKDPDKAIKNASNASTIAVVGDIRRSQDLMTYAQEPKAFTERMVHFITTTRKLVEKHAGLFDKFTGDGFIVYFNEVICGIAELNYIECFIDFIRDELTFCVPFFNDWERSIRKRPATKIGLAIGADIGIIKFEDVHDHLIAVGDSIVLAARMGSIAESHEVIVNNLLFNTLNGRPGVSFKEREGKTKSGENFMAQALIFNKESS